MRLIVEQQLGCFGFGWKDFFTIRVPITLLPLSYLLHLLLQMPKKFNHPVDLAHTHAHAAAGTFAKNLSPLPASINFKRRHRLRG